MLARNRVGEPAGGVAAAGGGGGGLPGDYHYYNNHNMDGGYPYGYYPAPRPPLVPAMYYRHPGLRDANVEVLVDINDNRYGQQAQHHGADRPDNPTVPQPYPPRPRPRPKPMPPPCPGHDFCADAYHHCQGTCGACGHVGCGGRTARNRPFPPTFCPSPPPPLSPSFSV